MTTFDWAGLWRKTADVFKKHGENIAATTIDDMDRAAANYLRTRIEAAFVPVEQRDKAEALLFQRTNEYIIATARAEAAEAEVRRLDYSTNHTCWDECPRVVCAQRRKIEALTAQLAGARESERAAVVAWLREHGLTGTVTRIDQYLATAIEAGEHLT